MSLKSLSVLCGVVLAASVGCGDSGTGGSGGGSGGSDDGGSPPSGGSPTTGGAPEGGAPEGGAPSGGSPGEGGAGGAPGSEMNFSGSGFGPHNDQMIYVQVRDSGGAVIASDSATVSGGNFAFTFSGIDATGGTVDYYADVNGDGACTTAGQPDHVWRVDVTGLSVEVTHNTNFSQEACDGF